MENDALTAYLESLSRDQCYRVERVLKGSARETTEVVYFVGSAGGELGPFVRKRINEEAGMGQAYQELLAAWRSGRRFRHLPRVYDAYRRDDEFVVVMEYVAGRTLHDEARERGASVPLAAELFPRLCDGVIEMHEELPAPLIHRDLKPTNVIVSDGGLTIIDFGIARIYRTGAASDTTHFGTRAYAPPEQFGYGQTDVRSDIYALGLTLYYLLTEETPDSDTVTSGFPALQGDAALQQVLIRATAFDPVARFQSARELKEAFLEAVGRSATEGERARDAADAPRAAASPAPPAPVAGGAASPIQPVAASSPIAPIPPAGHGPAAPFPAVVQGAEGGAGGGWAAVGVAGFPSIQRTKPSEVLGLVWDILVFLVWLLCFAILVSLAIGSSGGSASYPLPFRILLFPLCFGAFFAGIAYGLLDKRWLRRHIPLLRNQTFPRGLLVAAVIVGLSMTGVLVLMGIYGFFSQLGQG